MRHPGHRSHRSVHARVIAAGRRRGILRVPDLIICECWRRDCVRRRAVYERSTMEHDAVPNVVWSWRVLYGARAKYKTRRYTWITPRFSSLFWSSFCCLGAAGTAADAGTKKKLVASYFGAEEEICCRSKSPLGKLNSGIYGPSKRCANATA